MALYQDANSLRQYSHPDFDNLFPPRSIPNHSGIYRCTGCGREIVMQAHKHFPPYDHHQHSRATTRFLWKMIVGTQ
jgi:hypothetical protein